MKELIPKFSAVTFSEGSSYSGTPEVTDISYDLWRLTVTLRFESVDHPVYVHFDGSRGFRVLDEGDLLEFWEPESRPEGWLWRVESGGWKDLEALRSGFVSGSIKGWQEFLIGGIDDCVSVFTEEKPTIESPG